MALLKQTQLHCFIHVLYCSEQITIKQRDLVKKKKSTEKTPKSYLKVLSHEGKSSWVFFCLCEAETDWTCWILPYSLLLGLRGMESRIMSLLGRRPSLKPLARSQTSLSGVLLSLKKAKRAVICFVKMTFWEEGELSGAFPSLGMCLFCVTHTLTLISPYKFHHTFVRCLIKTRCWVCARSQGAD